MHLLKVLLVLYVSAASLNEEKYSPHEPPPDTGWKSALKFFNNGSNNTTRSPATETNSDASYDQYLSLDNTIVLNSELSSSLETEGRWGLNLGYAWDHSRWLSQGIYLQYFDHQIEKKYSLMTGVILPGIEMQFPLYLKANVGLGYFRGDFDDETLTLDYSGAVGLRLFSQNRFLFHVEFGSQNYHRLLRKSYTNSWVLSSGLAFIF